MFLFNAKLLTIAVPTVLTRIVAAGSGGWITLINSTPYEWRLTYAHQYQMQWKTATMVRPGTTKEFYYEFGRNSDDGAEATYQIVGHPTGASFTVQARGSGQRRIQVQYHDHLASLNNPENSLIDLGWERDGAVPFILAGDGIDTPFISSNPPVAWMQATLPTIGNKELREVCRLGSHDSGASEITRSYIGIKHNVLTQSGNVYQQLINGARSFDIRPVVRNHKWYTEHISVVGKSIAVGAFGRTIRDIISDINQFNVAYPGELIVLDITHNYDRNSWRGLNSEQWQDLYRELLAINDIGIIPSSLSKDITRVPISKFIQPGSKSSVMIRIPNKAPLPNTKHIKLISRNLDVEELPASNLTGTLNNEENTNDTHPSKPDLTTPTEIFTVDPTDIPHPFSVYAAPMTIPSASPESKLNLPPNTILAFFRENRFPRTGRWSDTESPSYLAEDQLNKLFQHRTSRSSAIHRSTWTITQGAAKALDVFTKKNSILYLSASAHRVLFRDLWGALSKNSYPNVIEVDDIWGNQFAALCMAVNSQFASGEVARKRLVGRERRILEALEDGARNVVKTFRTSEDAVLGRLTRAWEEVESEARGVIKHFKEE